MSAPSSLEPRDRFLRAIAERIPPERIAAIHLFPALRAGGWESAVAVIAAEAPPEFAQGELPPPVGDEAIPEADAGGPPPEIHDTAPPDDSAHPDPAPPIDPAPGRAPRLVVYRAVYRWTRKGPDRGKWEVDVTAEADAPLQAVSDVVRGVQRRAGEDGEPELISPAALRVALSDRPWAAAM